MSDDLNVVIPDEVSVVVNGETLVIHRIKVKQLSMVMATVTPFYEKLKAMKVQNKDVSATLRLDLFTLVTEHCDDVFKLLSVLTDKPIEFINELGLDEAVQLFAAVLEVNLDFFTQKVLPSLSRLMASLVDSNNLNPTVGQTPFKS